MRSNRIDEIFLQKANERVEKTAFELGGCRYTFGEIIEAFEQLSVEFSQLGLDEKSNVVVCAENGVLIPVLALVCCRFKSAITPLPPSLKGGQLSNFFSIAQPDLVVLTDLTKSRFDAHSSLVMNSGCTVVSFESSTNLLISSFKRRATKISRASPPIDCFAVNLSSGSTGDPKAIYISQEREIARLTSGTIDIFNLSNADVVLVSTPQYHSLGFRQSLLPLILGCTGVVMNSFNPSQWCDFVARFQVTFAVLVSSQLCQIASWSKKGHELPSLASLTAVVSSSAPFDEPTRQACMSLFDCSIYETYGTSETGTATLKRLSPFDNADRSVGYPLPFVSVRIDDFDTGMPILEPYKVGEICIRSDTEFSGYLFQEKKTFEAYSGGYFRTGDSGFLDEKGEVHFAGRLGDIIQRSGISVYPADVEKAILSFPGVEEACVVGIKSRVSIEQIVGVFVGECSISIDEIFRHLLRELSPLQVPQQLRQLSVIPFNEIGKVDRAAVRALFLQNKG